jgi:SAM-dependent methyltransferase
MISTIRTLFKRFTPMPAGRGEAADAAAADAGLRSELRSRIDLLLAASRRGEAAPLLFEAVDRDPDDAGLRRALAHTLHGARLGNAGDRERRALAILCADDDLSTALLSTAICTSLETMTTPEWADSALLTAALPRTVFADPEFEKRLAQVRRGILRGDVPASPAFRCALARHCFLNEYAFAVEAEEDRQARDAQERAAMALRQGAISTADLESLLVTACLYVPLRAVIGDRELPSSKWSAPFAAIIEEQVNDARSEGALAATMPVLTRIEGEVTAAVQAQYEENPYPRWACLQKPDAEPFESLARKLRPGRAPRPREHQTQILIAGCGTGQHPLHVARTHPDSAVLAVDLSRASLAYAARMAERFAISNIRFAQADLLKLGTLGRKFDIVESVGVLHHLADPMEGWRVLVGMLEEDGLMRIALYSTRARTCLGAAREVLRPLALPLTPGGIRMSRQAIMDLPSGHPARGALGFGDFYSLSGCRDLLMHVQEHTFTPLQVGHCLDALGLTLLKVECEAPAQENFSRMFPDPAALTDFGAWDRLEQAIPDTFRGMIQFWCAR